MTTHVDIEYVSPITYELFEWELPAREPAPPPEAEASDVSQNDLGYFMTMAGRHELLTAEEERTLGAALWTVRRRLLRILRRARAGSDEFPAIETSPPTRPVTRSTRRRLANVERLARELNDLSKTPGRGALPNGFTKRQLRAHRTSLSDTLREMDEVRRELLERNLRLVVWVAKRFRGARVRLHRRHPRRKPWFDARGRSLRPRGQRPVLDVRDPLDPTGHSPRARRKSAV